MTYHLDEIDRSIIHALMEDARNTSATMIAENLNVSDGTVRNRIERLEEEGVIQGYTAMIDFEQAGGRLTAVYICTTPGAERERIASAVQSIPGVIHIRVLMLGRPDFQVVAVGEDTNDLRRIAEAISSLGITIEDEELVETEVHSPYQPFTFEDDERQKEIDRIEIVGDTDIIEIVVPTSSPVVGRSLKQLRKDGVLADEAVVISIEREGDVLTPDVMTEIQSDDILTILPRDAGEEEILDVFFGKDSPTEV